MAFLTEFPAGYQKPEALNKSFDMIVRDWSRQQFGGDAIVERDSQGAFHRRGESNASDVRRRRGRRRRRGNRFTS
jgi:hypothetical protein